SMDRQLALRFRIVAYLLGQFERLLLQRGRHGGLPELTQRESRQFWSRMLEDHADAVPIVGPKTFSIRSEARPSRLGLFRRAAGWYLSTYGGPNDGVVAVRDQ